MSMKHASVPVLLAGFSLLLLSGCDDKSGSGAASSEEAAKLSAAAAAAATNAPADALDLADAMAGRTDVSDADRAAVLKAQQAALKALAEKAAAGDAAAQGAIEKYRARK
jgi:hypothetical protein